MHKARTFASRDSNHDRVLLCVMDGLDTSGKIKTATGMRQSYICKILHELRDRELIVCVGRVEGKDIWRPAGKVAQKVEPVAAVRESSISPIPLKKLMGRRA